jgi:hypothetical protein
MKPPDTRFSHPTPSSGRPFSCEAPAARPTTRGTFSTFLQEHPHE